MKKIVKKVFVMAAVVFALAGVSGCFAPRVPVGYAYPPSDAYARSIASSAHPIVFESIMSGSHVILFPVWFGFFFQFNVLNGSEYESRPGRVDNQYFTFNSQTYYIKNTDRGLLPWDMGSSFSVYRARSQSVYLGSFIGEISSIAHWHNLGIHFVYGDYIYYQMIATRRHSRPIDTVIFHSKHAFSRFCLRTGVNEEVSLEHFFERLYPIYEQYTPWNHFHVIFLNPDFRVRER